MLQQKKDSFHFTCFSNTGKMRIHNEDNVSFFGYVMKQEHQSMKEVLNNDISSDQSVIMGLFDGMGGECAGELASYVAAEALSKDQPKAPWSEEKLKAVLLSLNEQVCIAKRKGRYSTIGSTAILLAVDRSFAWIANVGDSPAFLMRNGKLQMLTTLHNNAVMLRELGIERKPQITQFLGIDSDEFVIEPSVKRAELEDQDIILLCSDGLTDMVSTEEIQMILQNSETLGNATDNLMQSALEAGGHDNITIILCQYEQVDVDKE